MSSYSYTTGAHMFAYLPCSYCETSTLHKGLTCVHCKTQFASQVEIKPFTGPITIKRGRKRKA